MIPILPRALLDRVEQPLPVLVGITQYDYEECLVTMTEKERKFKTWVFSDFLLPRIAACTSKEKACNIAEIIKILQLCIDISETCDLCDTVAQCMVEAVEVCSALMLLCHREIKKDTEVGMLEVISRMNRVAGNSADCSMLAQCGRNVKEGHG